MFADTRIWNKWTDFRWDDSQVSILQDVKFSSFSFACPGKNRIFVADKD